MLFVASRGGAAATTWIFRVCSPRGPPRHRHRRQKLGRRDRLELERARRRFGRRRAARPADVAGGDDFWRVAIAEPATLSSSPRPRSLGRSGSRPRRDPAPSDDPAPFADEKTFCVRSGRAVRNEAAAAAVARFAAVAARVARFHLPTLHCTARRRRAVLARPAVYVVRNWEADRPVSGRIRCRAACTTTAPRPSGTRTRRRRVEGSRHDASLPAMPRRVAAAMPRRSSQ